MTKDKKTVDDSQMDDLDAEDQSGKTPAENIDHKDDDKFVTVEGGELDGETAGKDKDFPPNDSIGGDEDVVPDSTDGDTPAKVPTKEGSDEVIEAKKTAAFYQDRHQKFLSRMKVVAPTETAAAQQDLKETPAAPAEEGEEKFVSDLTVNELSQLVQNNTKKVNDEYLKKNRDIVNENARLQEERQVVSGELLNYSKELGLTKDDLTKIANEAREEMEEQGRFDVNKVGDTAALSRIVADRLLLKHYQQDSGKKKAETIDTISAENPPKAPIPTKKPLTKSQTHLKTLQGLKKRSALSLIEPRS